MEQIHIGVKNETIELLSQMIDTVNNFVGTVRITVDIKADTDNAVEKSDLGQGSLLYPLVLQGCLGKEILHSGSLSRGFTGVVQNAELDGCIVIQCNGKAGLAVAALQHELFECKLSQCLDILAVLATGVYGQCSLLKFVCVHLILPGTIT